MRLDALPRDRREWVVHPGKLPEGTYRERFWDVMSQAGRPEAPAPEEKKKEEEQAEEETRWADVLEDVYEEQQTGKPWWQNVGIFLAWAAGFAGAAAVVVIVLLGIVDLLSKESLFNARTLSDWLFWASAILMLLGLISPSASDQANAGRKKGERKKTSDDASRQTRSLRRRIRRVYDPWRWRLWAAAIFAFGLSMLAGTFA